MPYTYLCLCFQSKEGLPSICGEELESISQCLSHVDMASKLLRNAISRWD